MGTTGRPPLTAAQTTFNPKSSKSTVIVAARVPLDTAKTLRTWAEACNGRVGLIMTALVEAEKVRRELKERMHAAVDRDT